MSFNWSSERKLSSWSKVNTFCLMLTSSFMKFTRHLSALFISQNLNLFFKLSGLTVKISFWWPILSRMYLTFLPVMVFNAYKKSSLKIMVGVPLLAMECYMCKIHIVHNQFVTISGTGLIKKQNSCLMFCVRGTVNI